MEEARQLTEGFEQHLDNVLRDKFDLGLDYTYSYGEVYVRDMDIAKQIKELVDETGDFGPIKFFPSDKINWDVILNFGTHPQFESNENLQSLNEYDANVSWDGVHLQINIPGVARMLVSFSHRDLNDLMQGVPIVGVQGALLDN